MPYIELNCKITPVKPFREILVAELAEFGFESFVEEEETLLAYIPEKDFDEKKIQSLQFEEAEFNYTFKAIEDENWNATWESSFEPVKVDDQCIVRASFHEVNKNYEFDIIISPKMSFGTGHHQTTYLMIQAMLELNLKGKSVLDMGSGTGVLAILAEKQGADSVLAVDIEDWAYENAKENIAINNCTCTIVEKGDVSNVKGKHFDVILANINKNVLKQDLSAYKNSLNPSGKLLLSGFFTHDNEELIELAKALGLIFVKENRKEEWSLLAFSATSNGH